MYQRRKTYAMTNNDGAKVLMQDLARAVEGEASARLFYLRRLAT